MKKILHMQLEFINLQDSNVQNQIKNLCQGKSGVYLITNLKNNKKYVGSAITKKPTCNRLYFRFRNHFFNHHKEFPLKIAVKKYGVHNFSWKILEFTEISLTRTRETFFIQTLLPEYNILQSAESSLGYNHTLETREKMKKGYSDERRQRISNLNKDQKLALEVRDKISQAALNRTAEQKQKHKNACIEFNQRMFSKPTQVLDGENLKILGNFKSLREACRTWNGNYRTFKRAVKSGIKIKKLNIYVKYIS